MLFIIRTRSPAAHIDFVPIRFVFPIHKMRMSRTIKNSPEDAYFMNPLSCPAFLISCISIGLFSAFCTKDSTNYHGPVVIGPGNFTTRLSCNDIQICTITYSCSNQEIHYGESPQGINLPFRSIAIQVLYMN
jgi:hypothetical protein